jgi:hypothetical protein
MGRRPPATKSRKSRVSADPIPDPQRPVIRTGGHGLRGNHGFDVDGFFPDWIAMLRLGLEEEFHYLRNVGCRLCCRSHDVCRQTMLDSILLPLAGRR